MEVQGNSSPGVRGVAVLEAHQLQVLQLDDGVKVPRETGRGKVTAGRRRRAGLGHDDHPDVSLLGVDGGVAVTLTVGDL